MSNPFKPISISLIPNYALNDIVLCLKLLVQPKTYIEGPSIKLLEEKMKKYFGRKYAFLFESGRAALYFCLKGLGIGTGDEVLVQAFTCAAVPNSVLWTGARPIYVDIDETYNLNFKFLEKKISPKTKAVVVQHTFGAPAQIEQIKRICQKHCLFLIEDIAHGLGNSYRGEKLGTFGDASVLSFGRDKVVSGIWGGGIITDNPKLGQELREITEKLPSYPREWIRQQLLYPFLTYLSLAAYSLLGLGKVFHHLVKKYGLVSEVITANEKQGKVPDNFYKGMPNPLAELTIKQFNQLEKFVNHRRKVAQYYSEKLKISYHPSWSYLRYPLENDGADFLRKLAAKKGVFLGDWYNSPVSPKDVDLAALNYQEGSCPRAEGVCQRIINLPTNPNLSLEDAEKVVKILKDGLLNFSKS